MEVCTLSNSPAPPSGALFHYPLFALAPENCGIDVCSSITPAQLGAFLRGDVRATYVIDRGGTEIAVSCMFKTSPDEAAYYADAGWFSPGCEVEDSDGDGVSNAYDCNDRNASVYPGAPEYGDGYDYDCDGGDY